MRKKIAYGLATILIICLALTLIQVQRERAHAYDYTDEGRWIVRQGDTLWTIAAEYSDDRHDIRRVIHIIRNECNDNISAVIHPGQIIYVPLFDCMGWDEWTE